jgi:glucokinase
MKTILTADIGGTNSRFGHFRMDENQSLELVASLWLPTQESPSFRDLLARLDSEGFSLPPDKADLAVFAVPGPVEGGSYCAPPHIAWDIDLSGVRNEFGLRQSFLINDFVAQAFACISPVVESALEVIPGKADETQAKAVVGAGTALGQAVLFPDGKGGYLAAPSEGGHAAFPFDSESELEFMRFLLERLDGPYIMFNDVVSGSGLALVHLFLTGENQEPEELEACARKDSDTVRWMARFYARASRHYALQVLALGGVYIAGGVAAKLPCLVTHDEFSREFRRSPDMGHILKKIPVFLNSDEESGLWGAAMAAQQHFGLNF